MTETTGSRFVYVTYIRTSAERLWATLIDPAFMKQYWLGAIIESDWTVGGSWKLVLRDGVVADTGDIIAFEPCRRLALRWHHEVTPELKAEGWAVCTMDLEPIGDAVKLTVTHSIERKDSKLIHAVSGGWPQILSNLKSLIETGTVVLLTPQC